MFSLDPLSTILLVILLWFLLSAISAPFEALGWWAGWYGGEVAPPADLPALPVRVPNQPAASHYIVFLTGISGVQHEIYLPREREFLKRLADKVTGAVIVDDIFPYSVTNRALTHQRIFAWFWRYTLRRKEQGGWGGFLINIRNLFQVAVSADFRYGPMYNQGSTELILKSLKRYGYPVGSGIPVVLIGYSGGGQIALGSTTYLKRQLKAPIVVIGLGGVMCSDVGLEHIEHLYYIRGERDSVQRIGAIFFPGRWSIFSGSYWNQAKAGGKISYINLAKMQHNGPGGYLDDDSRMENGQTYLDTTVATMLEILRR
ncbi:MAG: hypothetical protein H6631_13950 [Anaerolineaceae bacterium]|nr:hypothetical protein [Anaerolineaceae bacterium]